MKIGTTKIHMKWIWIIGLLVVAIVGGTTLSLWYPAATSWVDSTIATFRGGSGHATDEMAHEDDPHSGHDHEEHDH
ncbi:hypothetical protein [Calycomorphotria hydatis]|uniref:Uncharacterized protein n=1 Tax=Calycomorphotria hydatis TaxID=2528027 RepID=A0A517TE28_9PLAN|nr:hypothetical protein [Calycomorphotria hydatis]QDT66625.1 hypothetical protein V22_38960 [Calycomorphotria hydatis]